MRLALIGSHGVGKTTLAERLSHELKLPMITEVARQILREWGVTSDTLPKDRILEYQWEVLRRQLAQEEAAPAWISDRSTLDPCAYLLSHLNDSPSACSQVFTDYLTLALSRVDHYDGLFFLPTGAFHLEADGERFTDPTYQQLIDRLLRSILRVNRRGYTVLSQRVHLVRSEGVDNRVKEVLAVLEGWHHG